VARDDRPGGSSEPDASAAYVRLRTWHWRLRLFSGITVVVLVMEGWGIALVFTVAIGIVGATELAARRLARRDAARFAERAR